MNNAALWDQISFAAGLVTVVISLLILVSRRRLRLLAYILMPLGIVFGVIAAAAFWYDHRPLPSNERRMLFQGIEYIREVQTGETDPKVVHVVRIDLDTPGLSFLVTPGTLTDGYDQKARATSQFVREFGVQLAINADGFTPWWDRTPFDFYPHEGDPVNLYGPSASRGDFYATGYARPGQVPILSISADNVVSFNAMPEQPYNLISGLHTLIVSGVKQTWGTEPYMQERHPRTAIAVDHSGRMMLFILVDGRQPHYSEGAALDELARIALDYGAWDAINLDGGGSSTLVVADEQGQPVVLNSPIHTRVPGRERPIANHLGVFALPLDSPVTRCKRAIISIHSVSSCFRMEHKPTWLSRNAS